MAADIVFPLTDHRLQFSINCTQRNSISLEEFSSVIYHYPQHKIRKVCFKAVEKAMTVDSLDYFQNYFFNLEAEKNPQHIRVPTDDISPSFQWTPKKHKRSSKENQVPPAKKQKQDKIRKQDLDLWLNFCQEMEGTANLHMLRLVSTPPTDLVDPCQPQPIVAPSETPKEDFYDEDLMPTEEEDDEGEEMITSHAKCTRKHCYICRHASELNPSASWYKKKKKKINCRS